jgi:hypothetical protein
MSRLRGTNAWDASNKSAYPLSGCADLCCRVFYDFQGVIVGEIRRPKSEIRKKTEGRRPNIEQVPETHSLLQTSRASVQRQSATLS